MECTKLIPVDSSKNLKSRVEGLLGSHEQAENKKQLSFDLFPDSKQGIGLPTDNISSFLDFISWTVPDGDVYLFGGVLRDLALLGQKGFNSDIDLVVEGDWSSVVKYLYYLKAEKNKFGGFRLMVAGWPVDIWSAKDTWAIRRGYVAYKGIASLTETTVINWDAILMNWRTKHFIHREKYFEEIGAGIMDIVLEENPYPLGMAVRVFRHFCLRDVKTVTKRALEYLMVCANAYRFDEIRNAELKSYGSNLIFPELYNYFNGYKHLEEINNHQKLTMAKSIIEKDLIFNNH